MVSLGWAGVDFLKAGFISPESDDSSLSDSLAVSLE
jgi:hypothetical protein